MSSAERENLSALVDGELSRDQVRFMLRRIDGNVSLRAVWSRYHIIRDGMRHEVCVLAQADFAERVMREIADGIESPARAPRGHTHHWLRWSAGGAIAAGVAAVALIVVQPQMPPSRAVAPDTARVAATQPAASRAPAMVAPAVPRWLSASPSAAQLAQPAAADFYTTGPGRIVEQRGYAQHLDPYMTLPGYRPPTTREARRVMHQLWSMSPHPVRPPRSVLRVQAP